MQASTLDLQINSLKYTIRSSNFYVTCIDPLGNNINSRSREKHQFLMALGMKVEIQYLNPKLSEINWHKIVLTTIKNFKLSKK